MEDNKPKKKPHKPIDEQINQAMAKFQKLLAKKAKKDLAVGGSECPVVDNGKKAEVLNLIDKQIDNLKIIKKLVKKI